MVRWGAMGVVVMAEQRAGAPPSTPRIRSWSNPSRWRPFCRTLRTMNLIRIDHVSLDVRDRPASLAWYEEVLGLRPRSRHDIPDQPVFLGSDGAQLGLFAERPPGLRHIALATDDAGQRTVAARLDRL